MTSSTADLAKLMHSSWRRAEQWPRDHAEQLDGIYHAGGSSVTKRATTRPVGVSPAIDIPDMSTLLPRPCRRCLTFVTIWLHHAADCVHAGRAYGDRPPLVIASFVYPELEAFMDTWRRELVWGADNPHNFLFSRWSAVAGVMAANIDEPNQGRFI